MNKQNKPISIWSFFFYISIIIILLCGLTTLLSSCEEIIEGKSLSGKMVTVRFSLDHNSSGGDEAITRNYGAGSTKPETAVIPLDDNLFMYITLSEDNAVRTRSLETLVAGSKVRVVAYKDNFTTTTFSSIHTVQSDGSLVPGVLEVAADGVYTFVAYGYNDGTTPVPFPDFHSGTVTNLVANEFVCGIVPGIMVDPTLAHVHIPMKRMYSNVKVRAETNLGTGADQGFQSIGTVNITPYYTDPTLSLPEGVLLLSVPDYTPLALAGWTPDPVSSSPPFMTLISATGGLVCADYFAEDHQIKVEFSSLTVGGVHFPKTVNDALPSVIFHIEVNKDYTLLVTFSTLEFAVSNIYWDDMAEKLTFEPAVSDGGVMGNPDNKQNYQGVYFKFGSLVGISPRDANFDVGSDTVNGTDGTPVYVPDDINLRTWKKTNVVAAYDAGATWNSIRPAAAGMAIPIDPNNRFMMEAAQNQPDKWADRTGDICQYIDNRYRLPTAYELWGAFEGDTITPYPYYYYEDLTNGWEAFGDWNTPGIVNDSGTGIWANRGATLQGAYFPGGEYITGTGSSAIRTNYWEGAYWSGSLHVDYSHQYGAYVKISHEAVTLGDFFYETDRYAMSIRCVRK